MDNITLKGKTFIPYLNEREILEKIEQIAAQINKDYYGKKLLVIPILNGSFLFAADLVKKLDLELEISFVKLKSYQGISSTGNVQTFMGLDHSIKNKHVLIVEDIIDTGRTLHNFITILKSEELTSLKVASLLLKPTSIQYPVHADYYGFKISKEFVVGYGMDYDGVGRNLSEIYRKVK